MRLTQHFELLNEKENENGDDPNRETNDLDDENNTSKPVKKKPHPWRPFLRIKSLVLPPSIQQHLTKYGTDPEKFLSDQNFFTH